MSGLFYFMVGLVVGNTLQLAAAALVRKGREDEARKQKKE